MLIFAVTGASGHLGNTVIRVLNRRFPDAEVRALVLKNDPCDALKNLKCRIFYGDVTDRISLTPFFIRGAGDSMTVIHCAGIVSVATKKDPAVYNVNVTGTKNVTDMCAKNNCRMVYVSSVHAIPLPDNGGLITETDSFSPEAVCGLYAETKAEATQYVLESCRRGLNASVVHPSGIIGPYDYGHGHITQLIIDSATGALSASVDGGYDFVDVRDVAQGIAEAAVNGEKGQCYILSGGFVKISSVVNAVRRMCGYKKNAAVLPMWLAKTVAPLAEGYYKILRKPPLYTRYSLMTLCSDAEFSSRKAREKLGYTTHSMRATLVDTVNWLRLNKRLS